MVEAPHERDAPIHPLVGDDRAVGGHQPRVRWHDHPVHSHAPGDLDGVERSGTPVGHQVELAVVEAPVDGDEPHGAVHVLDGDRDDGVGGVGRRQSEAVGQRGDGSVRPVGVEAHPPPEEVTRVEAAHHHVGVGHGGSLAAEPVARRTGVGTGALGADLQQPAGVDGGDGSATRPDRGHIQDRQRQR